YGREVRTVFYRQLECILVCALPNERFWGKVGGKTLLLALIHPCNTQGRDATKGIVMYSQTTAPIVTDLRVICAVVGRLRTRNRWGIVDRSQTGA
ncbi:hypothetical protein JAAARDRAFT_139876, partial [Jaapia argillacea MUCL 33604]